MKNDKIVVIMGGTSTEAAISRQTGTAILNALKSKNYNAVPMELHPETFAEEIRKETPPSSSTRCTANSARTA